MTYPQFPRTGDAVTVFAQRKTRSLSLAAMVLAAVFTALAPTTAGAADLFNNWNKDAVNNAPTAATVFTLVSPAHVTELATYHWNNARGLSASPVVTIAVKTASGAIFGPFPAVGSSGQGGVPNVNWTATVSFDLPAGTYTVIDSQPATWSQNSQSGHSGFAIVRATPGAGPGSNDGQENRSFEYAVKFVCGSPIAPVVAPGEYFTAINVHNPSQRSVVFRKKIAVALPGEKAGRVSRFFEAQLKSDEAFEIDCQDILRHAEESGRFLKGFVVIETPSELDVVAVYTAGHPAVETLEIEHVQPRQVAKGQIAGPADPSNCPAGPGQVGNVGCCCNLSKPGGGFWPDCRLGLSCVSEPGGSYAVCSKDVSANLFLDPLPGLDPSQPPYCGGPPPPR